MSADKDIEPADHDTFATQLDAIEKQQLVIEEKLDRLLELAEKADTAITGFLSGKNAKYLALLAKAKGGGW